MKSDLYTHTVTTHGGVSDGNYSPFSFLYIKQTECMIRMFVFKKKTNLTVSNFFLQIVSVKRTLIVITQN